VGHLRQQRALTTMTNQMSFDSLLPVAEIGMSTECQFGCKVFRLASGITTTLHSSIYGCKDRRTTVR
jgi:hypothetical protein